MSTVPCGEGFTLGKLPAAVLTQQILPRLDPRTICSLAVAGNHFLRRCCEAEEVWEPFAKACDLERREKESWRHAYARHVTQLCTICRRRTPYIFQLTGQRLCDACEHANPGSYALVSACEATEAYGLTASDLLNLRGPLRKLGTSFYLRREVESASTSKPETKDPSEESDGGSSDGGGARPTPEGEAHGKDAGKQTREQRRAARKANKKQVKQEKRDRRMQKNLAQEGNSGASPATRLRGSFARADGGPIGVSSSASASSSARGGGQWRRKPPSANSRRQSHVRQTNEMCAGPSARAVSTCSGWIRERERLMAEFGEFGISGLELARDDVP